MACQIKFIEQSSLSNNDKLRFEEIYNDHVVGKTPSEISLYEIELSKQFFDTGYFDNSEDGDFFIYTNEAYPYMIQDGNVITSAPKDISNYILKNYNQVNPDISDITSIFFSPEIQALVDEENKKSEKIIGSGKTLPTFQDYLNDNNIFIGGIKVTDKNIIGIEIPQSTDRTLLDEGNITREEAILLFTQKNENSKRILSKYFAIHFIKNIVDKDNAFILGWNRLAKEQRKIKIVVTQNNRKTNPFYQFNSNIIVGLDQIEKSLLDNESFEDVEKLLDVVSSEELIHLIADYLIDEKDVNDIYNEISEANKDYIKIIYGSDQEMSKDSIVHEYIRMRVQHEVLGKTSELVYQEVGKAEKSFMEKFAKFLLDLLQRVVSPLSEIKIRSIVNFIKGNVSQEDIDRINNRVFNVLVDHTKEANTDTITEAEKWNNLYNSSEDYIKLNAKLISISKNKELTISQRIANIDNMVSFDMNELSFLTDLLKEINPEFKIEYLENLMMKQGHWGYADIEHFKAILDKRADKAFVSEEFCHLLLEAYDDKPFLREIGDQMIHTKLYQEQIKDYIDDPRYQKDGKPWMEKIKREFVGKALGYVIAGRSMDDIIGKHPQTKGLVGMLRNLWEKIKVLFTGKLDTKLMAVLSDIKNRRGFDMESITEFNKEIFLATTGDISLPGLDIAINIFGNTTTYFDSEAIVDGDKLTPLGEMIYTMYDEFNKHNETLLPLLKKAIQIVNYDYLLENISNSAHQSALLSFSRGGTPSFNYDHELQNVFFKSTQRIKVGDIEMTSPLIDYFETDNPIPDASKRTFKQDVINLAKNKKETSSAEEFEGLFQDTNINKFITLSELIQKYVGNLTRKGDRNIPLNYLVKNKISTEVLSKARSLKLQADDIESFATALRFIDSLDDLYSQLGMLSDNALLAGINSTEYKEIFNKLSEYKDLNDQLLPLLTFFSDHIIAIINNNNLAGSFNGIKQKIIDITGNVGRFNEVIKRNIIDQIAETVTDKVLPFNEKMYAHIKAIDASGSNDALVQANRDNYIKQVIGSYDADETRLRENTKNALKALLLGYSDKSVERDEIMKRLKEVEGDSENALARWVDNMVLGSTNSIDWFVQAMGTIVESEKNGTLFEAQKFHTSLASIENELNKYSSKEIDEVLTDNGVDAQGRPIKVFVSATRKDTLMMENLRKERNEVKRRIDLLVSEDLAADQLELDRLKFEIEFHKSTKFYGAEKDQVYEARMRMYQTLMSKFGMSEEELIAELFKEKQDSDNIYQEERVYHRNVLDTTDNELRLKAKNNMTKAQRAQRKKFEESDEANPTFKAIRESRREFNKAFYQSKSVISWYIKNVRARLVDPIPAADRRHIEEILAQPSNTEEERRILLLNLHGFVRDILSLRSFPPNVKSAVTNLVNFIDDTVSIIGNDDFYERRSILIAQISNVSAKLNPSRFIQPALYQDGTYIFNGKTIEYITEENYEALSDDDKKEVLYYLQKIQTVEGEKTFIRSAKRSNLLSDDDISGLWEQILDLVKDYKLPSGEIYLDPDSDERDELGRTPKDIRLKVKELEDQIENIKEQARQDSTDEEKTPEEKVLYKELFKFLEQMGQISKDNQTPYYFEEASSIIHDNQTPFDNGFDNHWDDVRRLSDMRRFRVTFQTAINNKDYIEHLLTANDLQLSPIDKWVKENHIITRTRKKNKESGEYEEGYRIKPAYYFRKILPSSNKDKKVILSRDYNVTSLKEEYELPYEEIKQNYPERLTTKGFYASRGLSPSEKYLALMNDDTEKGRDMRRIYQVLYKDIFLQAQRESDNNNGKLEDVFPSLEKFAHEDFKGYWKRTLWSQRNQFEEGLGNEPVQEVVAEEKRGWRERFFNFIVQIIKPATTKNEEYDRKNVPVFYTGYKDPKLLTNDVKTAIFAYIESLKQADSLQKNLSLVSSTIDVLKKSEYNANDHRITKLENLKKYQMRNSNQAVNGTLAKLYSLIPRIIRLTTQASWIPDTQVKNIIANFVQNVAANTTQKKPSVAPYMRAMTNMKGILSGMREYKTNNKEALIYKYLNPGSESFFNRFKQDHEWTEYLMNMDWVAFVPSLANNYDNLTDMYRMLDIEVKVRDSEEVISIGDAFTVVDGVLSFREDLVKADGTTPFTLKDLQTHVLAIKQVKFGRTGHHSENNPVNANFIARGVFSLAKYIFPIIRNEVVNAVGGRRRNIVLNELERSRFRDTWSFLLGSIYGKANNFNYAHLISNQGERRKAYATMVLISGAGLMYLFSALLGYHGYDDDDDKYEDMEEANDFSQFMISVFTKVNSELESSFITVNPNLLPSIIVDQRINKPRDWVPVWSENKSIVQRNLMMNFIFKDMAQFLSGIFYQAEFTRDDRLGRWEEGDNKTKSLLIKFNPIARWNERYTNAEEVVKLMEGLDKSQ